MKKTDYTGTIKKGLVILMVFAGLLVVLINYISRDILRGVLLFVSIAGIALVILWDRQRKSEISHLANDICDTVDALMEEREPENIQLYEETASSKVQGKLLQYYDKMLDGRQQSEQDKQIIQELVSDISHQVKTPVANLRMFTGILQQHQLAPEKQKEFLEMMETQASKLDFLMQSLIKMSRLETGTFTLHMEPANLYNTIAAAVSSVWTKAEQKNIRLDVECESRTEVRHDPKWTAEALGNILDNAVKYTPEGGAVQIRVQPWQFYTRIDIADTGIGIAEEHYHDVFQRFYRAQEVAGEEGVGLGLYLARGIISRQNGYISVKSAAGSTIFSVFLLS